MLNMTDLSELLPASLSLSLRPDNDLLWILSSLKHSSPGWRPWHIWCQNTLLSTQKLFTVSGRISMKSCQTCPSSGQVNRSTRLPRSWAELGWADYQSNWFLENIENSKCRAVCISVVHSQEVFFNTPKSISTFLAGVLSRQREVRTSQSNTISC